MRDRSLPPLLVALVILRYDRYNRRWQGTRMIRAGGTAEQTRTLSRRRVLIRRGILRVRGDLTRGCGFAAVARRLRLRRRRRAPRRPRTGGAPGNPQRLAARDAGHHRTGWDHRRGGGCAHALSERGRYSAGGAHPSEPRGRRPPRAGHSGLRCGPLSDRDPRPPPPLSQHRSRRGTRVPAPGGRCGVTTSARG